MNLIDHEHRLNQERKKAKRSVGILHERKELIGGGREDPLFPMAEGIKARVGSIVEIAPRIVPSRHILGGLEHVAQLVIGGAAEKAGVVLGCPRDVVSKPFGGRGSRWIEKQNAGSWLAVELRFDPVPSGESLARSARSR